VAGLGERRLILKLGAALIPLVGWGLRGGGPQEIREVHLQAIRRLVEEFQVQAVELNGDFTVLYPDVFGEGYYQDVARLQKELGFVCTLHLPFLWLDGASLAEPVREATIQCLSQVLEATRDLSIESHVLHLWGIWTSLLGTVQTMPGEEKRRLFDGILRSAMRTLEELGSQVPPGQLCVENLERIPFEMFVPLVEEQGTKICFDVGHLAVQGGDPLEFLDRYWQMIGEVHLHDAVVAGKGGTAARDHLPLGRGDVDYVGIMDELARRGYDRVLILEVNSEADLRESLERVQAWL
jgi:sugar phosphate isomerase/epimerase